METSKQTDSLLPVRLMQTAMILLITGLLFGFVGSLQYVLPGWLKNQLSFERVRPMHVSSVLFWIILAAMGTTLYYAGERSGSSFKVRLAGKIMQALLLVSVAGILLSYLTGNFGGREYWEYPPLLSIPIALAWVLFVWIFIKHIRNLRQQPVYVWMWLTGALFFLVTFSESYLYLIPYFRERVLLDMSIQWKSNGSIVGCWNLLIYGCSFYYMEKHDPSHTYSRSWLAFAMYFLGLFNLMFNWGHHIYTLPTHTYVRLISYAVSMTELIILARIIHGWKKSMQSSKLFVSLPGYRFMLASEYWILLNLLLAIAMSVPAINIYTHGTHITVAHAMGSTIGINSMLLLAFLHDIIWGKERKNRPWPVKSFWLLQVSLLVFWLALIAAGIRKGYWQFHEPQIPFQKMMLGLRPYFIVFMLSGCTLIIGLMASVWPLLIRSVKRAREIKNKSSLYVEHLPDEYHPIVPVRRDVAGK